MRNNPKNGCKSRRELLCMCMHVPMCICACVYACMCVYLCMCACVYVHLCIQLKRACDYMYAYGLYVGVYLCSGWVWVCRHVYYVCICPCCNPFTNANLKETNSCFALLRFPTILPIFPYPFIYHIICHTISPHHIPCIILCHVSAYHTYHKRIIHTVYHLLYYAMLL